MIAKLFAGQLDTDGLPLYKGGIKFLVRLNLFLIVTLIVLLLILS